MKKDNYIVKVVTKEGAQTHDFSNLWVLSHDKNSIKLTDTVEKAEFFETVDEIVEFLNNSKQCFITYYELLNKEFVIQKVIKKIGTKGDVLSYDPLLKRFKKGKDIKFEYNNIKTLYATLNFKVVEKK